MHVNYMGEAVKLGTCKNKFYTSEVKIYTNITCVK